MRRRQGPRRVEDARQDARTVLRYVQYDQHRRGEIRGKTRDELAQGLDSACGCSDDDEIAARHRSNLHPGAALVAHEGPWWYVRPPPPELRTNECGAYGIAMTIR